MQDSLRLRHGLLLDGRIDKHRVLIPERVSIPARGTFSASDSYLTLVSVSHPDKRPKAFFHFSHLCRNNTLEVCVVILANISNHAAYFFSTRLLQKRSHHQNNIDGDSIHKAMETEHPNKTQNAQNLRAQQRCFSSEVLLQGSEGQRMVIAVFGGPHATTPTRKWVATASTKGSRKGCH